jgi:hypothetical protein
MASDPIRIELRDVTAQREEAQRDLHETLEALEKKIMPQRVAKRAVSEHASLVLVGAAASGIALGLARSQSPAGRTAAMFAALGAGLIFYRLARDA